MIRTHLGRPLDLSLTSNRLIVVVVAVIAVSGGVIWLTAGTPYPWLAPVHTFLIWALVRELDPDRHWIALVASVAAGVWVLAGLPSVGALPVVGLLMTARIVLNPVGLRPLLTDLAAMAILASAISFTVVGWVAGSGIALALYIDARMARQIRTAAVLAAVAAALGASAVATVTQALPEGLPSVRPLIVVLVGILALIIVVRDPLPLLSTVDHSDEKLMSTARLHASRVLTVVLVFVAALLAGETVAGLGPLIIAFALVLGAEETERIRLPRL